MVNDGVVEHVPCLGCGCTCDDVSLVLSAGRIVEARNACELGAAWFGDGSVPARTRAGGRDVSREDGLDRAARVVAGATRPLVYLAPDISSEAQRKAIALADIARAAIDSVTSRTARSFVLAAQERGRAGATLGEIRHRADVVVYWGVDPSERYPRFSARYGPDALGILAPEGRRSRTVVAVDVGPACGPALADLRLRVQPEEEVAVLAQLAVPDIASDRVASLAARLRAGRYVVVVADGEPDETVARDPGRCAALLALVRALNEPTRSALCLLRAGGNRCGADAALTAHTGYPLAVDFAQGYPRYRPHDGTAGARLVRNEVDAVIVVGAAAAIPADEWPLMVRVPSVVIGPRASASEFAAQHVTLDTGVAGIHEAGTALRMDDVPLALRPAASGPPGVVETVAALTDRVGRMRRDAGRATAATQARTERR